MKKLLLLITIIWTNSVQSQSLTFDPVLGQYVYFYQCSQPMVVLRADNVHHIDLTTISIGDTIQVPGVVIAVAPGDTFDFTCYIPPLNSSAICISGVAQRLSLLPITPDPTPPNRNDVYIGTINLSKPYYKAIFNIAGQLLREVHGACFVRYAQQINGVMNYAIEYVYKN